MREINVRAVRHRARMPGEHFDKRLGVRRRGHRARHGGRTYFGLHRGGGVVCPRRQRAQQVARCLGARQQRLRQVRAEALLKAGEQFDARQAVETELALERAVETDLRPWTLLVQFGTQRAHHGEQVFRRGRSLGTALRMRHR